MGHENTELGNYLIAAMRKHNVQVVSYVIIDTYQVVTANTISLDPEIKVSTDSLFQACSLSKCLTAYGILLLAAQGRIDLNKPVNEQLLTWRLPENSHESLVTIRQCLSMTSGLCYGDFNSSFPNYLQGQPLPTLKNILNGTAPATNAPIKIGRQPGSRYHYTGAGFMLLQQLAEDKTEQPFTQFMDKCVLKPLAMNHSTFQCPLSEKWRAHAVPGFNANGKMNKDGWDNIPTAASGGLWSTSYDLANFVLCLTKAYLGGDNSVVSKVLAIEMLTQQKNSSFGLGIVVDGKEKNMNFRKNGYNNGYHNELMMFPNTGQGIIIMTNSANGILLIKELIGFVARRHRWPSYSLCFDEAVR